MMVSRAETRANYDRLSRWYDLLAGASERKYRELGVSALDVRPGERVLELGPGTGQALLALARAAGPGGAVLGLDLSPGMCRVARQRLAGSQPLACPATVLCGDAVRLPFVSDGFDAIFMSFTLELFDPADRTSVLRECRRLLRAEGRLGVVALSDNGRPGPMRRMYGWAHHRFPAWVDCQPIAVTALLAEQGYRVCGVTRGFIWGLPVEAVVARTDLPSPRAASI